MSVQTSSERFSSLTAMKAAHLDLTRRFPPGRTPGGEDLEEIERFVSRGRATGVLLDSHAQQRDAQRLLDHWAGVLTTHRRDVDSTLDEYDLAQAPDLEGVACPYPGLEAFQTDDALHFFGRSHLIEELVHRLESERFIAIVGPSGSGKSSLILAGLVPVLTRLRQWKRAFRAVPGADPLFELASAVGALPGDGPDWLDRRVEELRRSPSALPALLDAMRQPTILVVDQFEETFIRCDDASARQAFEACLVALIHDSRLPHRLLLSMRTDDEGHLTRMPRLWPEFVKARVALLPLSPHDLRDAIEGPAWQVGLKFEDGLVDALYRDVNDEPAALPLLQSILKQLWQRKHRNLVTWDEYKRLGNTRIALRKTADETSCDARADDEIDVAHQALVRNWPTHVDWLNQERSTMTLGRRLEARIAEWLRWRGRGPRLSGRNTTGEAR
jgi:energy-coupling factor transporter ATP-binding protein EcfA2